MTTLPCEGVEVTPYYSLLLFKLVSYNYIIKIYKRNIEEIIKNV